MIEQDTLASVVKYCKDLAYSLKARQSIDSSRTVLYLDTRPDIYPIYTTLTLAAAESKLIQIVYTHPSSPTPYAQPQYRFFDTNVGPGINNTLYRDSLFLLDEYVTTWILQLRNIGASSDTFTVEYGMSSSAPGTLTATVL